MYKVEIYNSSGYSFDVKSKDYQFIIDTKVNGITPPDTLLASLGSCIGVYLRKYADDTKMQLKEFKITVESAFSQDRPIRFKDIKVEIDLKGLELNEVKKNALLHFIKNCPVHNTLKINPNIDIKII